MNIYASNGYEVMIITRGLSAVGSRSSSPCSLARNAQKGGSPLSVFQSVSTGAVLRCACFAGAARQQQRAVSVALRCVSPNPKKFRSREGRVVEDRRVRRCRCNSSIALRSAPIRSHRSACLKCAHLPAATTKKGAHLIYLPLFAVH